ncbi:MAG: DUF4924 family protein, partial [Muribaculaceae bacterium]|nr:DUF4924 family protein [Muribaculaceae bacterium]
ALYGTLLMRLAKKELNADTTRAVEQIAKFIALLAKDYYLDEQDKLFPDPKE